MYVRISEHPSCLQELRVAGRPASQPASLQTTTATTTSIPTNGVFGIVALADWLVKQAVRYAYEQS